MHKLTRLKADLQKDATPRNVLFSQLAKRSSFEMKRKILFAIIGLLLVSAGMFCAISLVIHPSLRGNLKLYSDEDCKSEVSKVYFLKLAFHGREFHSINVCAMKNIGDDTIVFYNFYGDNPCFRASVEYERRIERLLPKEICQISLMLYSIGEVQPGIHNLNMIFITNLGAFSFPAEVMIPPTTH